MSNTTPTTPSPTPTPALLSSIEPPPAVFDLAALVEAAQRRIASQVNRAAGQHMRAWRKTYPSPPAPNEAQP